MGFLDEIASAVPSLFGVKRPQRNRAEEQVERILPGLLDAPQIAPPMPRPVDETGPLQEIVIDARNIKGPELFGSPAQGQPQICTIAGKRLMLRQFGTPPRARVTVDVGGVFHTLSPGHEIVSPFGKFSILQRSYYIPQDAGLTLGFQGELTFALSKDKNFAFQEPSSFIAKPWFRPPNVVGILDNAEQVNALVPQWFLVSPPVSLQTATAGCTRLRFYFAAADYPGASAATIAPADSINVFCREFPTAYFPDHATPLLTSALKSTLIALSWAAGYTIIVADADVTDIAEHLQLDFSVTGNRTVYCLVQGVP